MLVYQRDPEGIWKNDPNVPNHHPDNPHPINYSSSMEMRPAARSRAGCRYCAAGFQLCHPRPPADERGVNLPPFLDGKTRGKHGKNLGKYMVKSPRNGGLYISLYDFWRVDEVVPCPSKHYTFERFNQSLTYCTKYTCPRATLSSKPPQLIVFENSWQLLWYTQILGCTFG